MYQVVIQEFGVRERVESFQYKQVAKDYALQQAEQRPYGPIFEVVNVKTGILAGQALRRNPGAAAEWFESTKPTRRDVL